MMRRQRILFLTPHDSVRGPMAEACLRSICEGRVDVDSAAINPLPLHPLTIPTLATAGLPTTGLASKSARDYLGRSSYNTAIIIGTASEPDCPTMFFGAIIRRAWNLTDPSHPAVTDTTDTPTAFQHTLLHLRHLVGEWWSEHGRYPSLRSPRSTRPLRIPPPTARQP